MSDDRSAAATEDTSSVEQPVPGGDGVTESEVSPEELEEARRATERDPELQRHVEQQANGGGEDGLSAKEVGEETADREPADTDEDGTADADEAGDRADHGDDGERDHDADGDSDASAGEEERAPGDEEHRAPGDHDGATRTADARDPDAHAPDAQGPDARARHDGAGPDRQRVDDQHVPVRGRVALDDDGPHEDPDEDGDHPSDADHASDAEAEAEAEAPEQPREERLPGHADHVVVPIANPDTAGDLLRLAAAFAKVGGRVEALAVLLDDAQLESAGEVSDQLRSIVEEVDAANPAIEVELVGRPATSVARGILEQTRETAADLLLIGVPPAGSGGSILGRVAESVVDVAPCDVVMVRPGEDGRIAVDAERVVVTVDGSDTSRTAARSGVLLGDGLGLPVEVVHVQDLGRPRMEGLAVLAASLEGVEGREACRTRLLRGPDAADAVIAATQPGDLTLIGLRRASELRQWLFGSVSTDLLERSSSPVLVVARQVKEVGVAGRMEQLRRLVRPDLTDVEQENLLWQARRQAITTIDYLVLLTLSAILATFGLVQNSVAVIIGAMLVAPLLGPLSATSIALVTARTPLLRKGLTTLLLGTGLAVGMSLLLGLVLPDRPPTSEMLIRGQPSLLDLGVAMASGLVGAFATARRDVPAALAGVAIAAALVPPISTIGLGIAIGDGALATGATLLYLTNISAVTATGAAAFWWLGLRPVEQDLATRRRVVSASLAVGLSVVVVSVMVVLLGRAQQAQVTERDLRQELADEVGVEVTEVDIEDAGDVVEVTATVRSAQEITPEEVAAAQAVLEQDLERPVELRVVVLDVVTPPAG